MTENSITIPSGTIINGCKVIDEIGTGGMGSVYKGYDEALSRPVAIKIMHQASDKLDQSGKARFQREASAIANLDHSGIVKIYSYGEYEGRPFFVMEYVDGWSIKDFITRINYIKESRDSYEVLRQSGYTKDGGPDTPYFLCDHAKDPLKDKEYPHRVRRLMQSAASALACAHQQGIIHRDIKSSNLLIYDDSHLKLIDFGLVKQSGENDLTQHDLFMGTLLYASPEQLMGKRAEISFQSDVYSLGVVMYELATLSKPIHGDDPAAIVASITQGKIKHPKTINPNISRDFDSIIMKCLSRDPARRYVNAGELALALQQEGEQHSWFAGFTEVLKGWFFSEPKSAKNPIKPKLKPRQKAPKLPTNPSEQTGNLPLTPSQLFLKSARKNFYRNFAISEAVEDLKQSYEIDPTNIDTLFLLAFALLTVSDNRQIKHYIESTEQLIDKNDQYAIDKFNLIKTVFLQKNYEEGLRQSDRLHQIYPDDYDIFFTIFFCLATLGDYKLAIQVSNEIKKLGKKNNIISIIQSECYFSVMNFTDAIRVLQDRIAEYPRLYNLQLKIFQSLLFSGRYKEALAKTADILKKDPNNMLMHVNHARAQIFNDDLKSAFNTLRKAVGMPGDDMLKSIGYYNLYNLSDLLGREDKIKYLKQARQIRPEMAFLSKEELKDLIDSEQLKAIADEVNDAVWFPIIRGYARKICMETVSPKAYTIGNYGCTSFFVIDEDGEYSHSSIFSNFNIYDSNELFSQLWLPEIAQSPFIDEKGNILTAKFHQLEEDGSGIVSIAHKGAWKAGTTSYIYCRYSNGHLTENNGTIFAIPPLPQPACLHQAFIIMVPKYFEIESFSKEPVEVISFTDYNVVCYYPFLYGGQIFKAELKLKKQN